MTHEYYVTFEQAKALKELGFDWRVNFYYTHEDAPDGHAWITPFANGSKNANLKDHLYSAPTLSQAQKWLREVKGILVYASPSVRKNEPITWMIGLVHLLDKYENKPVWWIGALKHDTFKHALIASIDKALEILKEE